MKSVNNLQCLGIGERLDSILENKESEGESESESGNESGCEEYENSSQEEAKAPESTAEPVTTNNVIKRSSTTEVFYDTNTSADETLKLNTNLVKT